MQLFFQIWIRAVQLAWAWRYLTFLPPVTGYPLYVFISLSLLAWMADFYFWQ